MRLYRCVATSFSDKSHLCVEAAPASCGSSLPQEIIDVFVPIGISYEVSEASHSTSLKNAGGISLLERNREPCVPSVQHSNFPPMPHTCDLRAPFGNCIDRITQELQCLLAPTAEGLDRERDEPPAWQGPSRVPPMLAFCGAPSSLSVGNSRGT